MVNGYPSGYICIPPTCILLEVNASIPRMLSTFEDNDSLICVTIEIIEYTERPIQFDFITVNESAQGT